jgi:hypothetical protein
MTRFSAHVQYDDWKGTAAADDSGDKDIRDFARENGLLGEDEFLVGFEIYLGESLSATERYFSARAFVVEAGDHEGAVREVTANDPVEVFARDLTLTPDQFFALFKRFSVTLTQRGLDLEGRDYRERE